MYDIIIENGTIVDGTGKTAYKADIGIVKEKIAAISDLKEFKTIKRINANGLIVSPGFIDTHCHSDGNILNAPFAENKVYQGITTEIVGHCGFTIFPVLKGNEYLFDTLLKTQNINLNIDWNTTGEYIKKIRDTGIGINLVQLLGHSSVRMNVLGFDSRRPTEKELDKMKCIVGEAMQEGIFGLSSGLEYVPGAYANNDELVELVKVVSKYGGVYSTHMRDQGKGLINSIKETIELAEKSGVAINISHLKACEKENWGKVEDAIEYIKSAKKNKIKVLCDFYPYTATDNALSMFLPTWVQDGGVIKTIERISNYDIRLKLREEIPEDDDFWSRIIISRISKNKNLLGLSITEMKSEEKDNIDTFLDLLIEEKCSIGVVCKILTNKDIKKLAVFPDAALGSDAFAIENDISGFMGHPRNFGTFPRYIYRYIIKEKLISMEEGIRRITSLPASFYNIKKRGVIKVGSYADITIFDKEKIKDTATYKKPASYSLGIEYVIINGKLQIENSKHNQHLCGFLLTRNN